MPRDTPPTIVQYAESASWATAGATKTTSTTVSWQTGDVVVCGAGCENNANIAVPTVTGLTFTNLKQNTTASTCGTRLSQAIAASSGSGTISCANADTTDSWGFGVWVLRGSDGIGSSAEQHTSGRTVSYTPVDVHSALVWLSFDFAAATVVASTPTPSHQRQANRQVSHYGFYAADLADQPSGSAVGYGVTGTGTGPFSHIVAEILGTTSAAAGKAPQMLSPRGTYFHHDPHFGRRGGCDRRMLDVAVDLGDPRARAQARRRSLWTPRSVRLAP